MKNQGGKICGNMVRGARINDLIQRMIRSRVVDCNVGIGGNEGRALSTQRLEGVMQMPRWIYSCIAK